MCGVGLGDGRRSIHKGWTLGGKGCGSASESEMVVSLLTVAAFVGQW